MPPDLNTLACVNPECQHYRRPGENPLVVCKVYGRDGLRLLRYRPCGAECSERRGSATSCGVPSPCTLGQGHAVFFSPVT
jgi:hypothetical protein